jgi:hypothetical protein
VTAVVVTANDSGSLPIDYSRELTATGVFSDGITRKLVNPLSWAIDSSTQAIFDQRGEVARVRGVAVGNVTVSYIDIRADGSESGQVGTASLTIADTVLQSIAISPAASFSFPVEAQRQFVATGTFSDTLSRDITHDVVWDSSISSVAVFGADAGKLSTIGVGTSDVEARRLNSASTLITSTPVITVTAQNENIQSLVINPSAGTVNSGSTVQFSATATFTNIATPVDFTERVFWSWETNNFDFVTVSTAAGTKGEVTGIRAGGPFILKAEVPALPLIPQPTATVNVQ